MISITKLLSQKTSPGGESGTNSGEELSAYQAAYQATLVAISANGQRAVPALGGMISAALDKIKTTLTVSPEAISTVRSDVDTELRLWADKAEQLQKDNERAVRELLTVVSRATESTGLRDEKFGHELGDLSARLRNVAGIENIPLLRRSILDNATALTTCIARMADESRSSVRRLTAEIAEYRSRLHASERRALIDSLTGLCNRRGFEQELELRVTTRQQFSVLVADLNGFKAANDRYGHMAGDQILRQFATEFKAQLSPDDLAARWSGDEFVAIIGGSAKEGIARTERIKSWVFGEYKISADGQTKTVMIDAALGTASWNGVETGAELFARADREMYRVKDSSRDLAKA